MAAPALRVVGASAPQVAPDPRFLEVADRIGWRIAREAVWHGPRCSWLVWTKEPRRGAFVSVLKSADADLYQGVAGIGLFLARLYAITGEKAHLATLVGAGRQLHAQLAAIPPEAIGLFTGITGAARALTVIGEASGRPDWVEAGLASLDAVATTDAAPGFDVLSGLAGVVAGLAEASVTFDRPPLLDAAERMADRLVEAGVADAAGLSWPSGMGETRNLLGLSHGAAGIALALCELDHLRPSPRRREAAAGALRYERAHYDAVRRNWPDFRLFPGLASSEPQFPVAWCHGSTGVGLARLRLLQLQTDDPALLPEVDAALANAVAALNAPILPIGGDFTLCHGLTGQSELALEIGVRLARPDCVAAARRLGEIGLEVFDRPRHPWPCGIDGRESPALMLGTAGIGLHYLRLFDPGRTPGVLLPPAAAPTGEAAAATPAG